MKKSVLIVSAVLFFAPIFCQPIHAVTCDANIDGKSDAELQAISDQCDADIAAQQVVLGETKKQSATLKQGIAELTAKIKKAKLEINANAAKITKLGKSIVVKTQVIGQLTNRMDTIKKTVSKLLRDQYATEQVSGIEVLLSSQNLSAFFTDVDNNATIKSKLHDLIGELTNTQVKTKEQKKDLETQKTQQEKLKFEQETAKKQSENLQKEKKDTLIISKGKEAEYQKMIATLEGKKNAIRNRLFKTVGGEVLTFGDALKVIQPYESTVGVSAALVLAVLTQESSVDALIGKNIGKCFYNQSASNNNNSVMSPSQIPSFLAIMSEIGLNPSTTPVSCPIYSDGSYGGAMGPAQFMPKTWWDVDAGIGYKSRVGTVIGSSVPSPFNNREAFVGTALYLKDAQSICMNSYSKTSDIWACAASKYYGGLALKGSRLKSYMYGTYGYGHQVAVRAAQFQNDIDTLNL